MKVYVMRHGETILNKRKCFQGLIDIPLSESGIKQAIKTANYFMEKGIVFDSIWSSPLERALQTAELVSGLNRSNIIKDDRLKELSFGILEGKPFNKMNPDTLHTFIYDAENYIPVEGGESVRNLVSRAGDFLEDLKDNQKSKDNKILVVSHGALIRGMMIYLNKANYKNFGVNPIKNCEWHELVLTSDRFIVIKQIL